MRTAERFWDRRYAAISNFMFLRFINPAIVTPASHGIKLSNADSDEKQKQLIMLAGRIQQVVSKAVSGDTNTTGPHSVALAMYVLYPLATFITLSLYLPLSLTTDLSLPTLKTIFRWAMHILVLKVSGYRLFSRLANPQDESLSVKEDVILRGIMDTVSSHDIMKVKAAMERSAVMSRQNSASNLQSE